MSVTGTPKAAATAARSAGVMASDIDVTARRLGQVIYQKAFQPVAPSIEPASYRSCGISCRPL